MTEPAHAEALAARLARGEVDAEALRWMRDGFAAWSRAGGEVSLERCLRLRSTPFQRRVRQRNAWLSELARLVDAEPGEGPIARRVHGAWESFLSRGPWRSWRDLDTPPAGAAELHVALYWCSKFNDGDSLSVWHIHDLLRGFVLEEIPGRPEQDEGSNTTTSSAKA
ncbi:MAG: hypothetical protein Q8M01_15830 [Rubrivivax sp.]|nr:hypothetical protein [Rubrivivax sp.]